VEGDLAKADVMESDVPLECKSSETGLYRPLL